MSEERYAYVGEITREYEVMEVDGPVSGTEAIAEIRECRDCGDAVLNTETHDVFHQRIDEAILHPMMMVRADPFEERERLIGLVKGLANPQGSAEESASR